MLYCNCVFSLPCNDILGRIPRFRLAVHCIAGGKSGGQSSCSEFTS